MLLLVPTVATTSVVDNTPDGVGMTLKLAVDLLTVRVMVELTSSSMSTSVESLTSAWEELGMRVREPTMKVRVKQDTKTINPLMMFWILIGMSLF